MQSLCAVSTLDSMFLAGASSGGISLWDLRMLKRGVEVMHIDSGAW